MAGPTLGIALGGGTARGLAHIPVLEVLDELGVRPAIIVGSSMGALVGAAYASGIPAAEIRAHALAVLGRPRSAARHLFSGGEKGPLGLITFQSRPVSIDGTALVRLVLMDGVAARVEDTEIPFMVTATDFYAASEVVIRDGDLAAALAASIAVPGVISAPRLGGRLLVDGAIANPVPFDHVQAAGCGVVMGVEVTGRPTPAPPGRRPGLYELTMGTAQIMQLKIAELKRRLAPPDIWITVPVSRFRAHELLKVREILEAGDSVRETVKRQGAAHLEGAA